MGTPLYTTDIIPLTSRPTLTVMDDGDYFVILDTSTGKISKILKTNIIMTALKISYDNTSGLTAETVQAALDELVVNLGSSDDAILALSGRLDTLEGTGEGSVTKAIDDYAIPLVPTATAGNIAVFGSGGGVVDSDQALTDMQVTLDNLVVNGDFLQGTTGWTPQAEVIDFAVVDGIASFTGVGIASSSSSYQVRNDGFFKKDNKFYLYFTARRINESSAGIYTNALVVSPTAHNQYIQILANTFAGYSGIIIPQYTANITLSAPRGLQVEIDKIGTINLTQIFGAGNEPTASEMDELLAIIGWFDGSYTLTQKQILIWLLNRIRANRTAIVALGGTF